MNKIVPYLKSKTLWVAAFVTSAGVVQAVQPFIPPEYLPVAIAVIGALQAGLRLATTKPVSEK